MHLYMYSTYSSIHTDIPLELVCACTVCGSSRVMGWRKRGLEEGAERSMAAQWLVAEKLSSELPAMSWGDKKRHHLKLTQLFSCESQSTPSPYPFFPCLTHPLFTQRPQTHNLPKTTNRATTTANQHQHDNTQGKPTRMVMAEGHSLPPPTKRKWEIMAKYSRCCICSSCKLLNEAVYMHISWFTCDGDSRLLATNWNMMASCQRSSIRTWCLCFLFNSRVGFHWCIPFYI